LCFWVLGFFSFSLRVEYVRVTGQSATPRIPNPQNFLTH
jgi:hypothetical protein